MPWQHNLRQLSYALWCSSIDFQFLAIHDASTIVKLLFRLSFSTLSPLVIHEVADMGIYPHVNIQQTWSVAWVNHVKPELFQSRPRKKNSFNFYFWHESRSRLRNDLYCVEWDVKLLVYHTIDTSLSALMMWNLHRYPTTVLNERMWHFRRGQNILWPLLHIFRRAM